MNLLQVYPKTGIVSQWSLEAVTEHCSFMSWNTLMLVVSPGIFLSEISEKPHFLNHLEDNTLDEVLAINEFNFYNKCLILSMISIQSTK